MNAGSSFKVTSSASLIGPRYLIPCRMPNDSASAPMLAASQKWPWGRCASIAIAERAAAMPASSAALRSGPGRPLVPSQ